MDALAEYLEHLLRFVRMGDQTYARWAAPKYEKTDPFRLAGLRDALDVEIARYTQASNSTPSSRP